jgi:hypothetical protein
MSKVKIWNDIRCLILTFSKRCLHYFPLKLFSNFFGTNMAKNVCDLMITYARISTSLIYVVYWSQRLRNYLMLFTVKFPKLRSKYSVSQLNLAKFNKSLKN